MANFLWKTYHTLLWLLTFKKTEPAVDSTRTTSTHANTAQRQLDQCIPSTNSDTHKTRSGSLIPNDDRDENSRDRSSRAFGGTDARTGLLESKKREMSLQKQLEDERKVNRQLKQQAKLNNTLTKQKSRLEHELAESRSREKDLIQQCNKERQKHAVELEKLEKSHDEKYQQLQVIHARTIKEINGGIDPITDEYITKKFTSLRDRIGSWCRKSWGGLQKDPFQWSEQTKNLQDWGICLIEEPGLRDLNTADILQGAIWRYIEQHIFGVWLYGFQSEPGGELSMLENWLYDSASASPHTKPCEWRTYTVNLLKHSSQLEPNQKSLIERDSEAVDEYLQTLCEPRPKVSKESRIDGLKTIMHSAATLATELRTQKAEYRIDNSVRLKETYSAVRMEEVSFDEEDAELEERQAVVCCILSRGWVKVEDGLSVRICKASVRAL